MGGSQLAANASASGPRLLLYLGHCSCPQLFSIAAYPWPLALAHRRYVSDLLLRAWFRLPIVWLAFVLCYGLIIETKIFGELTAYSPALLVSSLSNCSLRTFVKLQASKTYYPFEQDQVQSNAMLKPNARFAARVVLRLLRLGSR